MDQSSGDRVSRYREQAAQARQRAHEQPPGTLRDVLLEVAEVWDELADKASSPLPLEKAEAPPSPLADS